MRRWLQETARAHLDVVGKLSVHVVPGDPRPTTAGKDTTTMTDLTETTEILNARLAAQTEIANTRDALLRTALALPNNLQYLADGGSFASCIVDLVRSIAAARLAATRAGFAYLHGSAENRAAWDAECAAATQREIAYTIERLQQLVAR